MFDVSFRAQGSDEILMRKVPTESPKCYVSTAVNDSLIIMSIVICYYNPPPFAEGFINLHAAHIDM